MAETPEGLEQIRVMVAELCGESYTYYHFPFQLVTRAGKSGWQNYPCGRSREKAEVERAAFLAQGDEIGDIVGVEKPELLPDYTTSLDAMAEAWKTLKGNDIITYNQHLTMVNCYEGRTQDFEAHLDDYVWSRSALQHAIAFILCQSTSNTE